MEGINNLTSTELKEYREIFNLVDKNQGGTISRMEFQELMETLGIESQEETIDVIVNSMDNDGDGEICFEEFVAVMSQKVQVDYTPQQVKNSFKVFQGNNSPPGYIHVSSLLNALTHYSTSKTMSMSDAKELVKQLEPDKHGMINYDEYISMMMSN